MERDDERFEEALQGLGPAFEMMLPGDPEELLRRVQAASRSRRPSAWRYGGLVAALAALLVGIPLALHRPSPARQIDAAVLRPSAARIATLGPVDFLSARTGFIAGTFNVPGRTQPEPGLLSTTDGGRSFLLSENVGWQILALQFQSRQGGFAVGSQGGYGGPKGGRMAILETSDGGRSFSVRWQGKMGQAMFNGAMQSRLSVALFGQVGFAFDGSEILKTTDGGSSWTPVPGLKADFTPVQAGFLSQSTLFVTGQTCTGAPSQGNCSPVVLESTDGGQAFHASLTVGAPKYGIFPYSESLTFVDPRHGFFLWKNGGSWNASLYGTSDGGKSWTLLQPSFAGGRTIDGAMTFASASVGWLPIASGAAPVPGGLMTTANGGKTWAYLGVGRNWSIAYAQMLSTKVGFVVGGMGGSTFLASTTDGGKTFTQILPALAPTEGINFVNGKVGFGLGLAADPMAVVRTTDGGRVWRETARLPAKGPVFGSLPLAISFVSPTEGLAIVTAGGSSFHGLEVLGSSDGGVNWTMRLKDAMPYTSLAPQFPYLRLFPGGVAVLEDRSWPVIRIVRLTDGGRRSQPMQPIAVLPGGWSAVSFATPEDGFVVINGGQYLEVTHDGGKSWAQMKGFGGSDMPGGIDFLTPSLGYAITALSPAAGQNGPFRLLRTTNGGRSWTRMPGRLPGTLEAYNTVPIDFVSAKLGYILFQNGIYMTTDGGRTFEPMQ